MHLQILPWTRVQKRLKLWAIGFFEKLWYKEYWDISGPFRFSTHVWQNIHENNAKVCDATFLFFFYNYITLLKGQCAHIVFFKKTTVFILNLLPC